MPSAKPKERRLGSRRTAGTAGPPSPHTGLHEIADRLYDLFRKNAHRGTSVDIIYATIREAIRSRLIPAGMHLTELDLSAALGISRTPIREALQRLETEYLLEKSPRRGFVVPVLELGDIVEIFEVRAVLLGLAARNAAQRAGPSDIALMAEAIERMQRSNETGDAGSLSQASAQFHRAIEQAAKNRRLQNLIRLNSGPMPLYEFGDPDRFAPSIAEHCAIFDAIASHDADLAERLAHEHSRNALQAQVRAAQKMGDRLLGGE